jgi:hypothetical protein
MSQSEDILEDLILFYNNISKGGFNHMQFMTLKEAQSYLRKSKSALHRDIRSGAIKVVKIGSKPIIVKEYIDEMIRRQMING